MGHFPAPFPRNSPISTVAWLDGYAHVAALLEDGPAATDGEGEAGADRLARHLPAIHAVAPGGVAPGGADVRVMAPALDAAHGLPDVRDVELEGVDVRRHPRDLRNWSSNRSDRRCAAKAARPQVSLLGYVMIVYSPFQPVTYGTLRQSTGWRP